MLKATFIPDARDLLTGARCDLPGGKVVEVSRKRTPFFALCRELDKRGYGDCRIEISTPRGTPSLAGRVAVLAGLTITERDRDGLTLEKYRPFPPRGPLTDAQVAPLGSPAPENEEKRVPDSTGREKAA